MQIMLNGFSGVFLASAVSFVVPQLIKFGFSEACSNEIVSVGVPFLTMVGLMAWRYLKGDVTLVGKRK